MVEKVVYSCSRGSRRYSRVEGLDRAVARDVPMFLDSGHDGSERDYEK